jgi:hypothetical protein
VSDTPETEAAWAQKELSSIHRWIERNHADGFIDSLTYLQNLERVTDNWYDRLDKLERELNEARQSIEYSKKILKAEENEPLVFASLRVASERDQLERELNEACNNFEKALNLSEGRRQCIERSVTAFQIAMRERDEALEIIRKASAKFCEDQSDGVIAAEMFEILGSKLKGGAA